MVWVRDPHHGFGVPKEALSTIADQATALAGELATSGSGGRSVQHTAPVADKTLAGDEVAVV